MTNFAFGLGIGTQSASGEWLEVYYNAPLFNAPAALIDAVADTAGYTGGNQSLEIDASQLKALEAAFLSVDAEDQAEIVEVLEGTRQPLVLCILETDAEPATTAEVYLKLSLLSHRLVKPHGLNLAGMFGKLPNVAWTSEGDVGDRKSTRLNSSHAD